MSRDFAFLLLDIQSEFIKNLHLCINCCLLYTSFIEQNYALPITVEDMANRCNLDRSYFGKVFKDMIGQSPQDFLIRYRMSKATSLLTSTSLSIGDISVQVGYPNQLHFSRAFRNIYGMSPRQYRQQNKLLSWITGRLRFCLLFFMILHFLRKE